VSATDLYVAEPADHGPWPGLVILQEAFGLNDHIKDVTRRFAAEGYYAVAPDLFHRSSTRTVPYDDVRAAIGMILQLSDDMVMDDVNGAIQHLRTVPGVGKIGVVGFCFGGRSAYLAATRSAELSAVVGFYAAGTADPRNPAAPVTRTADITAPVLLLCGGQDRMFPREQVETIEQALSQQSKEHLVKVYAEAGHGFFCDARPENYNSAAADDAWRLTLEFLGKHLQA